MKSLNVSKTAIVLSVSCIIIFILLLLRNAGIYTIVSSDEATYSKYARLLPLAKSIVPSYIYLAIYRTTNMCGDGFLSCARILNTLFFVGAAPFIYLTARRVCNEKLSVFITVLSLLSPINSYTVYFMPESLYFFSFWILTWFILGLNYSTKSKNWALGGMLLGIMGLIKPHAFLILPAFCIFILYIYTNNKKKSVVQALKIISIFTSATFITKIFIGYVFVGIPGISIFGDFYSSIATTQKVDFNHYINLAQLALLSINGHVMALCLMFSLPFSLMVGTVYNLLFKSKDPDSSDLLSLYLFLIFSNIVMVVGLFTATVVNSGPYETIARLHMRYYSFIFPLFTILVFSKLSINTVSKTRIWRVLSSLPVGILIFYAACTRFQSFSPNFVDSPEMFGFNKNLLFLSTLSLLSLLFWIISPKNIKFFTYCFLPLSLISSSFYVNQETRHRLQSDIYDRAGMFTKQYLDNSELSKLVIVGPEYGYLFRALFHIDNPDIPLIGIQKGEVYNTRELPAGKEWILAIGDNVLPDYNFFQVPLNGFKLVHLSNSSSFDFKKMNWPGVLSVIRGLSQPEDWGTRTVGDAVTFEFILPLPDRFKIKLVLRSLISNESDDLIIQVNDSKINFKSSALDEEKIFSFNNPEKSRIIKILFANAKNPGVSDKSIQNRKLELGFSKLEIIPY